MSVSKVFFLNLRVDVPVRFVVFVFSLLHSIFILLEGGGGGGGEALKGKWTDRLFVNICLTEDKKMQAKRFCAKWWEGSKQWRRNIRW